MSNTEQQLEVFKNRYYDAVERHDQEITDARERLDIQEKALMRLIQATTGLDEKLDPHLELLRRYIQQEVDANQLLAAVERVGDTLLRDDLPGNDKDPTLDAIFEFLDCLALSELQQQILARIRSEAPDQSREQTLQRVAQLLNSHNGGDDDDTPSLRDGLCRVLEHITLPESLLPKRNAILKLLRDEVVQTDWTKLIDRFTALIVELRSCLEHDKQETETFLSEITERLKQLDEGIAGASARHNVSKQMEQKLSEAVDNEVQGIENSVNSAGSLDDLKVQLSQNMEALSRHISARKAADMVRNQQTEIHIQELQAQLAQMKQETEQLREKMHKARQQALHDALTGLPNRLAYNERMAQEYSRWQRFGKPLTVVLWDIDRFKRINDTYGHAAGDKALALIARILGRKLRETDFFARYGGEEFIMLMPGTDSSNALKVADKIRQTVEKSGFRSGGEKLVITVSAGISELRPDDHPDDAVERADQCLYRAKNEGRNRCITDQGL